VTQSVRILHRPSHAAPPKDVREALKEDMMALLTISQHVESAVTVDYDPLSFENIYDARGDAGRMDCMGAAPPAQATGYRRGGRGWYRS